MDTNQFLGMLVMAIITLGGLAGLIFKCYQPINKLNENIIKLTASIEKLLENDKVHERRLNSHRDDIDIINNTLAEHHAEIEKHEVRLDVLEKKNN